MLKTPGITELQDKPFELQVWFLMTFIASLRTLKAVIQNVLNSTSVAGYAIDSLIFLTLAGLCYAIYAGKIQRVPIIAGIVLLTLVTLSYIRLGGVQGSTEYNLMGLGVILALGYRNRNVVIMIAIFFAVTLLVNLDLSMEGKISQVLLKTISTSLDSYFTTLVTLLIMILYFKSLLLSETDRIRQLRGKLSAHLKTIKNQRGELEDQQQLLREANNILEVDIRKHTSHIMVQNRIIEDYVFLSTQSIRIPLQRIKASMSVLRDENVLEYKLKHEISALEAVIFNLEKDIKVHENAFRK
jgi:hypothetical protein